MLRKREYYHIGIARLNGFTIKAALYFEAIRTFEYSSAVTKPVPNSEVKIFILCTLDGFR